MHQVFKTKRFDTAGLFQNKLDYWEAQLLGYLDRVGAFVACFYVAKLNIVYIYVYMCVHDYIYLYMTKKFLFCGKGVELL